MSRKRSFAEEGGSQGTDDGYNEERATSDVDKSFRVREVLVPRSTTGTKSLKFISWNVNGFKSLATANKGKLLALIGKHKPDVLILQETKAQYSSIDEYRHILDGYESFWNCSTTRKGYSGTAVFINTRTIAVPKGLKRSGNNAESNQKQGKLSAMWKQPSHDDNTDSDEEHTQPEASTGPVPLATVLRVSYDFEDEKKCHDGEGRTITVEFDSFILVACYVPNSGEGLRRLDYRVNEWEPHMRSYLKALAARKPCILGGDLNCSFLDIDLHEPYMKGAHLLRGHTPEERRAFAQLLQETGFRDSLRHFYPETKGQFTFWDQLRPANRPHNKGVRLDYFLCSGDMYPGTAEGSTEGDEEQATGEGVAASAETALVPLPVKEERKVQVYDAYILHEDTVGYSDHCPIVLVLIV